MDSNYATMFQMFSAWQEQAEKLKNGESTKVEYDLWRHNYPQYDTTQKWAKVPSQDLSDAMVKAFKKQLKDRYTEKDLTEVLR